MFYSTVQHCSSSPLWSSVWTSLKLLLNAATETKQGMSSICCQHSNNSRAATNDCWHSWPVSNVILPMHQHILKLCIWIKARDIQFVCNIWEKTANHHLAMTLHLFFIQFWKFICTVRMRQHTSQDTRGRCRGRCSGPIRPGYRLHSGPPSYDTDCSYTSHGRWDTTKSAKKAQI